MSFFDWIRKSRNAEEDSWFKRVLQEKYFHTDCPKKNIFFTGVDLGKNIFVQVDQEKNI